MLCACQMSRAYMTVWHAGVAFGHTSPEHGTETMEWMILPETITDSIVPLQVDSPSKGLMTEFMLFMV